MTETVTDGWTVQVWDYFADYPDWVNDSHFHHRENADRRCVELVQARLDERNAKIVGQYEADMSRWQDMVALVAAGRRTTAPTRPTEPVLETELGTGLFRVVRWTSNGPTTLNPDSTADIPAGVFVEARTCTSMAVCPA